MLNSAVIEEKKFKHSLRVGGRQPIRAKHFMSKGRPHHYGHLLPVQKEFLQPLTLYTSFQDLINVYSHRSGADNPRGQNFDVNRNLLSLRSFATSLKKNSVWFYTIFFHDFIHAYSPRAGADNFLGTKFWCQQEPLVTSVICCKFQKISLKSDFIQ